MSTVCVFALGPDTRDLFRIPVANPRGALAIDACFRKPVDDMGDSVDLHGRLLVILQPVRVARAEHSGGVAKPSGQQRIFVCESVFPR
jgi:hypothetical protein